MTVDRVDFRALLEEREKRRLAAREPAISLLRQAATSMDFLTANEQWDAYLRMLQARRDETEAALKASGEALASPSLVNYEEILLLKLRIERLMGVLGAFDEAMTLPKQITDAAANG